MLDPHLVILDEPSMGLSPKVLKSVFDAVRMMNAQGKTILLVEQNARAGLRLSTHGVVLENGRVRLSGTGHEVLNHPEIGALYLGGAVTDERDPGGDRPPRPGATATRPPSRSAAVRRERTAPGSRSLIIDAHCHVIVPEMTGHGGPGRRGARPPTRERRPDRCSASAAGSCSSVMGEFSDVEVMLAEAAATGVDHLLLSPWINLVPVDAGPATPGWSARCRTRPWPALVAAQPGG